VYCAVGFHPHDSISATAEDYDFFAKASKNPKVVAIGEIGLDFFYDLSPRDIQKKVFVEQLELADSLKMPVILHLRDAYGEMLDLLKQNRKMLLNGCLLHCYSGSPEMASEFLKVADMFFAFGGSLTFKNNKNGIESLRQVPLNRIMLETDCPYLAPTPFRGQTNYPKMVKLVAEKAAEILERSFDEVCDITTKNVKELFIKIG
jgi:TatD DNase family protein